MRRSVRPALLMRSLIAAAIAALLVLAGCAKGEKGDPGQAGPPGPQGDAGPPGTWPFSRPATMYGEEVDRAWICASSSARRKRRATPRRSCSAPTAKTERALCTLLEWREPAARAIQPPRLEFPAGLGEAKHDVAGVAAFVADGSAGDFALGDEDADVVFRGVGVQRNMGMVEDAQELKEFEHYTGVLQSEGYERRSDYERAALIFACRLGKEPPVTILRAGEGIAINGKTYQPTDIDRSRCDFPP